MPKRIQRKRTKGWRMPPNTINVSRPSKWGNPYTVTKQDGLFVVDGPGVLVQKVFANKRTATAYAVMLYSMFLAVKKIDVSELTGYDLCCWCAEDEPCHADVLLEMANR